MWRKKTLDAFVESQAAADVPVILLECDALDAPQAGELLSFSSWQTRSARWPAAA